MKGFDKVMPGIKSYKDAVNEYHKFILMKTLRNAGGMLGIMIELV